MQQEITLQEIAEKLNEVRSLLGLSPVGVREADPHEQVVAEHERRLAEILATQPAAGGPKTKPSPGIQQGLDSAAAWEAERDEHRILEEQRAMDAAAILKAPPQKLVNNPVPKVVVVVDEGVCRCGCGSRNPREIEAHRKLKEERDRNRPAPSRHVLLDNHRRLAEEAERARARRLSELLEFSVPFAVAVAQAAEEYPPPPPFDDRPAPSAVAEPAVVSEVPLA